MNVKFTPTVGVAPGTTTMTLGSPALTCLNGPCPPDPVRYYTDPPNVKTGWSPTVPGPLQGMTVYDPYGTESQLKSALRGLRGSLRGLGQARPGVAVIAASLAFLGVVGYGLWKRRR